MPSKKKRSTQRTPSPHIQAVTPTKKKGLFKINRTAESTAPEPDAKPETKARRAPRSRKRPVASVTGEMGQFSLGPGRPAPRPLSAAAVPFVPAPPQPEERGEPLPLWKPKAAISKGTVGQLKLEGCPIPRWIATTPRAPSIPSPGKPATPGKTGSGLASLESETFSVPSIWATSAVSSRAPVLSQNPSGAEGNAGKVLKGEAYPSSPCSNSSVPSADGDVLHPAKNIPTQETRDTNTSSEERAPEIDFQTISTWFGWSPPRISSPGCVSAPLSGTDDTSWNFDRIIEAVALESGATKEVEE